MAIQRTTLAPLNQNSKGHKARIAFLDRAILWVLS